MDWLLQFLISAGIIPADKVDAAKTAFANAPKPDPASPAPSPTPAPPTAPPPAGYVAADQIAKIVEQAVADATKPFQERLDREEQARKTLEEERTKKLKEETEQKVKAALDEAEKDGRITSKEAREKWQKRLEADFGAWSEALGEQPKNPAVNRDKDKGQQDGQRKDNPAQAPAGRVDQKTVFDAAVSAFNASAE